MNVNTLFKPQGFSHIIEKPDGSITVWIGPSEDRLFILKELGLKMNHELHDLKENQKSLLKEKTGLSVRKNKGMEYGIHMNVVDMDQFKKYLNMEYFLTEIDRKLRKLKSLKEKLAEELKNKEFNFFQFVDSYLSGSNVSDFEIKNLILNQLNTLPNIEYSELRK